MMRGWKRSPLQKKEMPNKGRDNKKSGNAKRSNPRSLQERAYKSLYMRKVTLWYNQINAELQFLSSRAEVHV